ncbi:sodium:dicarboxylate symporter [Basidiobolus meristosporus CBS 931.73]|uniref:Amino acid transporter n=1 Tax=Basidiobolus meristosporus CBS 931.73 TaxID=1314790 RepID=A0A1Y1YLM6_9FUNG|nr:sodium:dicarboxylate symporter [Basidiobolus meristosporus CBS 931.73]|eukprot:ORX98902.1 sodium:dicarboxylate symporter [Basidiobolus meristosporus CBS 931.73]
MTAWIFIAMFVGILLGWLAPSFSKELKPVANIFITMIKCLIVPLIFATLSVGIAGHGDDLAKIGKLALKSIIYFEVVTTIALAIGLITVNVLHPGRGVNLQGASVAEAEKLANTSITVQGVLDHIITASFFESAVKNEVLQVVFCSIMFSLGMVKATSEESRVIMLKWLQSLSDIMFAVTGLVMNFAPIGIGASMAYTVGNSGISVLVNLGKLVGSLYLALIIFVLIVFVPIVLLCRLPIRGFLKAIGQPSLIAFSTASSEAALPRAMKNMEAYGVSKKIVAFVMPTGYSFNLDGSTLYLAMASVFAAQAGGISMPIAQQLLMMLTLMLTSKGVAAVPRASLVILSGALKSFNLPYEAVAVILGVDAIMDMGRTTVNLVGNCLATAVMARWEGEFRKDEVSYQDKDEENHIETSYEVKSH